MNIMRNDDDFVFSYGTDCKNNKIPMQLIAPEALYSMIRESDHDLIDYTRNLRSVLRYSKERYRAMKTGLPYFSCSVFDPAYRGVQHFSRAEGLVIDIDYNTILPEDLLLRFKVDPRVMMGYVSPSNTGVKLIFAFDTPVRSAEMYTALYRHFSHDFAMQYHIADHIDLKNCDVSRISFICHDPQAWYEQDAVKLDTTAMRQHVVTDQLPEAADLSPGDIPPSVYRQILQKLDSRPRSVKSPMPLHPEITDILPAIKEELAGYGITVKETESIQYGVKIRIYKDRDQGELNVYTGKNGYKIVTSPRKGTLPELNEVARHIIEGVLVRF